jgi:hypothetical protein
MWGEGDYPLEILHRYDEVFVKMNPKWWRAIEGAL